MDPETFHLFDRFSWARVEMMEDDVRETEEEESGIEMISKSSRFKNVSVTEERVFRGHTDLVYTVIHFPELRKFLTCSWDYTIRIWDLEDVESSRVFHKDSDCIFQLVKMNDDEFIAVMEKGKVIIFSVSKMKIVRSLIRADFEFFRVIKLDSDLLLLVPKEGELFLLSYSKKLFRKNLSKEDVFALTFPITSPKYENCFYINLSDGLVKLINYSSNKVIKEYNSHENRIYAFTTFFNFRNDEILVCGGNSKIIYFYNTTTNHLFYSIKTHDNIRKFYVFNHNHYLISCDYYQGYFTIFDITKSTNIPFEEILTHQIHSDGITDMKILSIEEIDSIGSSNSFRMISCSFDETIRISRIEGLPVLKDMKEKDLTERLMFLRSDEFLNFSNHSFFCFQINIVLSNPTKIFKSMIDM